MDLESQQKSVSGIIWWMAGKSIELRFSREELPELPEFRNLDIFG